MIVLSLFDGMACGYEALKTAGIFVEKYYASEIDPYAIKIAKKNHPDIIHLGDVTKWHEWSIPKPDLIIGGSPCQGFSFAGKQLAFDDPRSKLFFEMTDIIRHYNPQFKLLENVKMKKEFLDIITDFMDCGEPHFINSALVSAQSRQRYYWYNWDAPDPVDRGILLKDVIERNPEDIVVMSDKFVARNKNHGCLITEDKTKASSLSAMEHVKNGRQGDYLMVDRDKSRAIIASIGRTTEREYFQKNQGQLVLTNQSMIKGGRIVGRRLDENGKRDDYNMDIDIEQMLEIREDDKAGCLTTVRKDSVLVQQYPRGRNPGFTKEMDKSPTLTSNSFEQNIKIGEPIRIGTASDIKGHDYNKRIYSTEGKSPTSNACSGGNLEPKVSSDGFVYRKLTPVECERLQTLPDNYTEGVSNTQRYKMLGNGWTKDVIAHLFSHMPISDVERMMQ